MGFADDLKSEVTKIFKSQWAVRDGGKVPEASDVQLGNDAVKLDGVVLYADIDGSTTMVDSLPPQRAAEVYKAYLSCAARIIRSEGGEITAYDGDRVMAVFMGDLKSTRAVRSGMKIKWAVHNIINPAYKAGCPDSSFELKQVVGIDASPLFVARTGIRGANDLVWVGRAANCAAKMSAINEQPYSTWISSAIFGDMTKDTKFAGGDQNKPMWEARTWKGSTIYGTSWSWILPN